MEPHASDPTANGTSPAATAAPEPLDDPPVQAFASHGLTQGPVNDAVGWRYPMPPASSIMASLATSTDPASSSLRITAASKSKRWFLNGAAPQLVGAPAVARRSLSQIRR